MNITLCPHETRQEKRLRLPAYGSIVESGLHVLASAGCHLGGGALLSGIHGDADFLRIKFQDPLG